MSGEDAVRAAFRRLEAAEARRDAVRDEVHELEREHELRVAPLYARIEGTLDRLRKLRGVSE